MALVWMGEEVVMIVAMVVTKDQRENQMSHWSYETSGGVAVFLPIQTIFAEKLFYLFVNERVFV